jgi:hypothetical protein
MLMPKALGRLRRTVLWPSVRRLHSRVGPPICTAVHAAVRLLGPALPDDIVLKHRYDYEVLYLEPRTIERSLRVGEWARVELTHSGRLTRLKRWFVLGGGWKHLRRHVSRNVHGRFVTSGDWDLQYQAFEIRPTIIDMFVNGVAAEDTLEYSKLRDWVQSGEFGWTRGCRTLGDIDAYFAEMVRLYDALRSDGYREQRELGHDGADEIRVCIDRDGSPCVFGGGTHRLSMALLLDIPAVPVLVKRVHADWARRCMDDFGTSDVHEAIARGLALLASEPDGHPAHVDGR